MFRSTAPRAALVLALAALLCACGGMKGVLPLKAAAPVGTPAETPAAAAPADAVPSSLPASRPLGWSPVEPLAAASGAGGSTGPAGVAGMKIDGGTLWVAGASGLRQVDVRTGEVRNTPDMQRIAAPANLSGVGLSADRVALSASSAGTVQLLARPALSTVATLRGLKAPFDAIPLADGDLIYAEQSGGSITRASGPALASRTVLASGLGGPVQMVLGQDGALYVTESAGKLVRLPLDASAPLRTLADGLAQPAGLAQTPWGSFVVAENAARRLVEIDPRDGSRRTVAETLPFRPAGVAVGADGTVYVAGNDSDAIYRIRPAR